MRLILEILWYPVYCWGYLYMKWNQAHQHRHKNCHLVSSKPLLELMLNFLSKVPQKRNLSEIEMRLINLFLGKYIWKCCLQDVSHFVHALTLLALKPENSRTIASIPWVLMSHWRLNVQLSSMRRAFSYIHHLILLLSNDTKMKHMVMSPKKKMCTAIFHIIKMKFPPFLFTEYLIWPGS